VHPNSRLLISGDKLEQDICPSVETSGVSGIAEHIRHTHNTCRWDEAATHMVCIYWSRKRC